ncbi:MAG TPA: hypothetical protein VFP84_01605 [Kofleriaceae bacterium]|nr:hypothetical protein [Kofleriaceae bacterium]
MAAASLAAAACTGDATSSNGGNGGGGDDGNGGSGGSGSGDSLNQTLAARVVDYNAALRIAALRLTGSLPTLDEINQIKNAADDTAKKTAYGALIDNYMGRPTFAKQMFGFWQDAFKIGGSPDFDSGPALATELTINNGSYMDLFTKADMNCPKFDPATGTVTEAACANGGTQAGVLSNPGVMASYFSNLGFRRVRWVQETFDCVRFPVEATNAPQDVGGATPYLGVWPFTSIAGKKSGVGRIDFQDTTSTMCADCHETLNHIAPLFGNYDTKGVYQTTPQVTLPLDGAPKAQMTDWLPAGESTAWRFGQPAADLQGLGKAMSNDPAVASCGVARVWNWALGKTDIVDTLQTVPDSTIKDQVAAFTADGFKLKDLIKAIYTSDDFTKF